MSKTFGEAERGSSRPTVVGGRGEGERRKEEKERERAGGEVRAGSEGR